MNFLSCMYIWSRYSCRAVDRMCIVAVDHQVGGQCQVAKNASHPGL